MPSGIETTLPDPLPPAGARDPLTPAHPDYDYDALADLFLGEPPAVHTASARVTTTASGAPTAVETELLVSGHLPGASAPWPAQYASALADSLGEPVELVRAGAGEISVDLFGSEVDAPGRCATLAQALSAAQRVVRRVLLRTDGDAESTARALETPGRVTILCGADEASIVDAYRRIKTIHAAAPGRHRLAVAIMGADDIDAGRAREHLMQACAEFLDQPLGVAAGVRRIGPVPRLGLYRGAFDAGALGALDAIRSAVTPTPTPDADSLSTAHRVEAPQPAPSPPEDRVRPDPALPSAPVGPLAVRIEGLAPIESRCPYHDTVELAIDDLGGLAVVAEGGLERVGDLLAVRGWATDHARLLARAEPSLDRIEGSEPVLHMVTRSAGDAHALLAAGIQAHILARAAADGWACVPMQS